MADTTEHRLAKPIAGVVRYKNGKPRLTRPLYEGGERCNLRKYLLMEHYVGTDKLVWPPKAVVCDCICARDPHNDHVHECSCGARWAA